MFEPRLDLLQVKQILSELSASGISEKQDHTLYISSTQVCLSPKPQGIIQIISTVASTWIGSWTTDLHYLPPLTKSIKSLALGSLNIKDGLSTEEIIHAIQGLMILYERECSDERKLIRIALQDLMAATYGFGIKKKVEGEDSFVLLNTTEIENYLVPLQQSLEVLLPGQVAYDQEDTKREMRSLLIDPKLSMLKIVSNSEGHFIQAPSAFVTDMCRVDSIRLNGSSLDNSLENEYEVIKTFIDQLDKDSIVSYTLFKRLAMLMNQAIVAKTWGEITSRLMTSEIKNLYATNGFEEGLDFSIIVMPTHLILDIQTLLTIKDASHVLGNTALKVGYVAFKRLLMFSKSELQADLESLPADQCVPHLSIVNAISAFSSTPQEAKQNLNFLLGLSS